MSKIMTSRSSRARKCPIKIAKQSCRLDNRRKEECVNDGTCQVLLVVLGSIVCGRSLCEFGIAVLGQALCFTADECKIYTLHACHHICSSPLLVLPNLSGLGQEF